MKMFVQTISRGEFEEFAELEGEDRLPKEVGMQKNSNTGRRGDANGG